MQRREFLKNSLAAMAATQIPVTLAGELKQSLARPGGDWRLGWRNVPVATFDPVPLTVEGAIPNVVRGTLFRNGPARNQRGDIRYHHWFDGDGMIQRFRFDNNGITHDGKFVQTEKFQEEEAAGRFLYSAAGTAIKHGKGSRNNDSGNVANTALLPWHDELLALWEGGSAYRINPDTLDTIGRKDWRDDLQHMPFSAHPLVDTDGTLWNFGSAPYAGKNGAIFVYKIAASGGVIEAKRIDTPQASYAHSFLMTEKWLVVYLGAHIFSKDAETFVDAFQWSPELGSRVLLIDKNDLSRQQSIELPSGFVFHGAHAFDRGDDIIARISLYDDAGVMDSGMIELMRDDFSTAPAYPEFSRAHLATLRIRPALGSVSVEKTDTLMEFSGVDDRFATANTPVFGVGHGDKTNATISDAIVAVDPESGTEQRFVFPLHHIVEEPLFIADSSGRPYQGWLVGTFLDYAHAQSGVYILRSDRINDGPVAMARMERALPLGFHGCFV